MPVLCPTCGTVGHDDDRTCASCGTDLAGDPVALVAAEPASPARGTVARPDARSMLGRSRARAAIVVAVVGLATVAVVAGVATHHASKPQLGWTELRVRVPVVDLPARVRVVGLGPHGQLRIADLATGRVRELRRAGVPVDATTVVARLGTIVVRTFDGRAEAVGELRGAVRHLVELGRADALVPSVDPTRVWLARGSRVEQVGTDGRTFARATIPAGYDVSGGGLDGDSLLLDSTVDGTSIVWNSGTHVTAAGTRASPAIAAAAGVVIASDCTRPVATCAALAIDLHSRTTRVLDAPTWDAFEPPVVVGRVSPGGHYAAFGEAFPGHHDVHASITLVDTGTGQVVWTRELAPSSTEPTAWDDRGDLLFFTDGVTAFVHHVDGPTGNVFSLGPVRELDPVAVLPRPAPRPAGAARG